MIVGTITTKIELIKARIVIATIVAFISTIIGESIIPTMIIETSSEVVDFEEQRREVV